MVGDEGDENVFVPCAHPSHAGTTRQKTRSIFFRSVRLFGQQSSKYLPPMLKYGENSHCIPDYTPLSNSSAASDEAHAPLPAVPRVPPGDEPAQQLGIHDQGGLCCLYGSTARRAGEHDLPAVSHRGQPQQGVSRQLPAPRRSAPPAASRRPPRANGCPAWNHPLCAR